VAGYNAGLPAMCGRWRRVAVHDKESDRMSIDSPDQRSDQSPSFDRSLDVRTMNCPLPILKTKAEFARMRSGEVLKVTYQQKQYVKELEMFSRQTGNRVVHTETEGDHHSTWIEKV
jgi:tRNA 2-thiouridine synthesizing protein A